MQNSLCPSNPAKARRSVVVRRADSKPIFANDGERPLARHQCQGAVLLETLLKRLGFKGRRISYRRSAGHGDFAPETDRTPVQL
jgi:hypothetical protein